MSLSSGALSSLISSYLEIRSRIEAAKMRSEDPGRSVQLVAVSKHQPVEKMQALLDFCAGRSEEVLFGESYILEFKKKQSALRGLFRTHLIGRLQSNKMKDALRLFNLVESVDSVEHARVLNMEAQKTGRVLDVYIQVNISRDPGKVGFSTDDMHVFIREHMAAFRNLKMKGLMTIPMDYRVPEKLRADFRSLRGVRDSLINDSSIRDLLGTEQLVLSMGMSGDFEIAIEEGADEVRIGTAIFGERE